MAGGTFDSEFDSTILYIYIYASENPIETLNQQITIKSMFFFSANFNDKQYFQNQRNMSQKEY